MTCETDDRVPARPLLGPQDERLRQARRLGGAVRGLSPRPCRRPRRAARRRRSDHHRDRLRNPQLVFLSSDNLSTCCFDSCAVGIIALGIVCVLLVAEIDLSVGSVSGLLGRAGRCSGSTTACRSCSRSSSRSPRRRDRRGLRANFNRFGVPSFVVTLAGLLAFLGAAALAARGEGRADQPALRLAARELRAAAVRPEGAVLCPRARRSRRLFAYRLHTARAAPQAPALGAVAHALSRPRASRCSSLLECARAYLNPSRRGRVDVRGVLPGARRLHALRADADQVGRSLFAIGGNPEAARRAGINVTGGLHCHVFMMCSTFAALGGASGRGTTCRRKPVKRRRGRRQPQRDRGGGDRRNEPLRRSRFGLTRRCSASSSFSRSPTA